LEKIEGINTKNPSDDPQYNKLKIVDLIIISILSVLTQELFRWLFWILLNKAEDGLNAMSEKPKSPLNKYHFSFGKL